MAIQVWSSPKFLTYANYDIVFSTETANSEYIPLFMKYIHSDPSDATSPITAISDAINGQLFYISIDNENQRLISKDAGLQYNIINASATGGTVFETYVKYHITPYAGIFIFSKTQSFSEYRIVMICRDTSADNSNVIGFETCSTIHGTSESTINGIRRFFNKDGSIILAYTDVVDRCLLNNSGASSAYLLSPVCIGDQVYSRIYTVDGGLTSLPLLQPFAGPQSQNYLTIGNNIVASLQ